MKRTIERTITREEAHKLYLIARYCELQDDYWYFYSDRDNLFALDDPREKRRAHWLTVALNEISSEQSKIVSALQYKFGLGEDVLRQYYKRCWNHR